MVSDLDVRLKALVEQLENGQVSLPDAAAAVRKMKFPPVPQKTPHQTMEDSVVGDPDPPGPFATVSGAYAAGRIDRRAYETLAAAAAAAMKGGEADVRT